MKYIFLNHRYDELLWCESIHKYGETWSLFIPPSPTISKVEPMVGEWERQFLSSEMMSKMLYMSKLIAKILNATNMFLTEFSSFKSIAKGSRNDGNTALYNIVILFRIILMDELVECHIPSQKNQCLSLVMLTLF